MKRILAFLITFVMIFSLCACSNEEDKNTNTTTKIKFSQSVEELQNLDGQKVEINGFMSLLSPLNGELIYLMNIPFQSCPYCLPNTSTLSNTIAVKGTNIEFTSQPVKIIGTLKFANYVDAYGYEYGYRIEDAEIVELDAKEVSETMRVYYTLAENSYIEELYAVMSYIDQVACYQDYGFEATDFDSFGTIPFPAYSSIHNVVTSLNTNGEYNDYLEMLELTKETMDKVNTSLEAKDYEHYNGYKDESEQLFTMFNAFINKYEF